MSCLRKKERGRKSEEEGKQIISKKERTNPEKLISPIGGDVDMQPTPSCLLFLCNKQSSLIFQLFRYRHCKIQVSRYSCEVFLCIQIKTNYYKMEQRRGSLSGEKLSDNDRLLHAMYCQKPNAKNGETKIKSNACEFSFQVCLTNETRLTL